MPDTELASMIRHLIDDCGYSWATVRHVIDRAAGRPTTIEELKALYKA